MSSKNTQLNESLSVWRRPVLLACLLVWLVSGCAGLPEDTSPTALPEAFLPTAVALTLQAGQPPAASTPQISQPISDLPDGQDALTAAAEVTPSPVKPTRRPTSSPQPSQTTSPTPPARSAARTPTPTETAIPGTPESAVQIYRPGNLSRVTSPLKVSAHIMPGWLGQTVRIELLGEDGRTLVRVVKNYQPGPSSYANLSLDLEFGITAVAEAGRLVISVEDEQGRMKAINSVDLILLSLGEADINPVDESLERIIITEPRPKAMIQGGHVLMTGQVLPKGEGPLVAELVTEEGKVVGMRVANLGSPTQDGYLSFSAEIPYTVDALTPVSMLLYEKGEPVSPLRYLTSLPVLLGP